MSQYTFYAGGSRCRVGKLVKKNQYKSDVTNNVFIVWAFVYSRITIFLYKDMIKIWLFWNIYNPFRDEVLYEEGSLLLASFV